MQIVFPTRGNRAKYPAGSLIQGFGENPQLYRQINQPGHNGWDIVGRYGSDILAPHNGIIVDVSFNGQGYGNRIDILSPVEDGIAILSTLGHMTEEKLVREGDRVQAGQVVGKMGNSGFVVSAGVTYWGNANPDKKGTHLHWTPKRLVPVKPPQPSNTAFYGQAYKIINYENAYRGAFDPAELFKESKQMEFFQVQNEQTIVAKIGSQYFEIATDPVFYPYLKAKFNIADQLNPVGRDLVNANLGGQLKVGITFDFK